MTYWLGLDVGTSSLKAVAVDAGGDVRARASIPYRGVDRVGEQDTRAWADAARQAIAECAHDDGLAGVSVTGQVPTIVLVNEHGDPVRIASTWQEQKSAAHADALEARFGRSTELFGFALPWAASQVPAKLSWLADTDPEARSRTRWFLQPKDYLGLLLTGNAASDPWSMKGVVRVPGGQVIPDVLAAAGWDAATCPPIARPEAPLGTTRGRPFGLPDGIPVSVGWSDALSSMFALGVLTAPGAFVISGTSDVVGLTGDWEDVDAAGLYVVPAGIAPKTIVYGPTQTSGASIAWAAALLGLPVDEALALAETADPAHTPSFVPYLDGERAPLWRSDLRAVVAGLDQHCGRAEFMRAVVDGVGGSARHILEVAAAATGASIAGVRVGGRGEQELVGLSAKAAALGQPLSVLTEPYVSAYGAAMLAAVTSSGGDWSAADRLRGRFLDLEPAATDRDTYDTYLRTSRTAMEWTG
ncbi:xylulokinase [Microbacterium sp. KHB019]|uniref:xylulokinase n=1 Tax=Microbacterium sp. KHB019 TaxID=3129770 RepID=UPI003078D88E